MNRTPQNDRPDYEAALADPASAYSSPEALLLEPDLTDAQKIEVLRRWAYDCDEIAVAEEEGMRGELRSLLQRILIALKELGAEIDTEHTPPTKQGGI